MSSFQVKTGPLKPAAEAEHAAEEDYEVQDE
jgi:hypothetical protein